MKRTLFLICGICLLLFGAVISLFLFQSFAEKSGWSGFSLFLPVLSAAFELARVTGLFFLAVFSLIAGLSLFLYGLSPANPEREKPGQF